MHTEYVTRPICLTGGRSIGLIVFNSWLPFIDQRYNTQKCSNSRRRGCLLPIPKWNRASQSRKIVVSCILHGSLTENIVTTSINLHVISMPNFWGDPEPIDAGVNVCSRRKLLLAVLSHSHDVTGIVQAMRSIKTWTLGNSVLLHIDCCADCRRTV